MDKFNDFLFEAFNTLMSDRGPGTAIDKHFLVYGPMISSFELLDIMQDAIENAGVYKNARFAVSDDDELYIMFGTDELWFNLLTKAAAEAGIRLQGLDQYRAAKEVMDEFGDSNELLDALEGLSK